MQQDDIMGSDWMEAIKRNGMGWVGKAIAVIIILAVAAFGDVMYVRLMQAVLPTGPLLVICYVGAFTSFLGTVYLLIGKTSMFAPGKQTYVAWLVLGIELLIIALNIILVFHGANDQVLSAWTWIAPATPVINMCFIAVLFFMDEEQEDRYKDRVLLSRKRQMDRVYKDTLAQAQMQLKHQQLQFLATELRNAVNSPDSLAFIQQTAKDMNSSLLSTFAGRSYGTQNTVDAAKGSGAVTLGQTGVTAEKGGVTAPSQPFQPGE